MVGKETLLHIKTICFYIRAMIMMSIFILFVSSQAISFCISLFFITLPSKSSLICPLCSSLLCPHNLVWAPLFLSKKPYIKKHKSILLSLRFVKRQGRSYYIAMKGTIVRPKTYRKFQSILQFSLN